MILCRCCFSSNFKNIFSFKAYISSLIHSKIVRSISSTLPWNAWIFLILQFDFDKALSYCFVALNLNSNIFRSTCLFTEMWIYLWEYIIGLWNPCQYNRKMHCLIQTSPFTSYSSYIFKKIWNVFFLRLSSNNWSLNYQR